MGARQRVFNDTEDAEPLHRSDEKVSKRVPVSAKCRFIDLS